MMYFKNKLALMLLISTCAGLNAASTSVNPQCVCAPQATTTALVPFNDGYALRYNFHKVPQMKDDCDWYLDAYAGYRFQKAYHTNDIIRTVFSNNPLVFQSAYYGGVIAERLPNALVAEYFGLPSSSTGGTNGSATLGLNMTNNIIDLGFTIGCDRWCDGLYFHVGVPVENAKSNLSICSTTGTLGSTVLKGYYSAEFVPGTDQISGFLNGNPSPTLKPASSYAQALSGYTLGDLKQRVFGLLNVGNGATTTSLTNQITNSSCGSCNSSCSTNGSWCNNSCSNSTWGVADILLQLGWDACKRDYSHFGFYLRGVIPTGTSLDASWAQYELSPVVGNGHHGEFGLGINAHVDLWNCEDSVLSLAFDGYVDHMFSASQLRYFDLVNKPMSRYELVKAFALNTAATPVLTYQNAVYTVADITAQCISTEIPVKGELVLDLMYKRGCWKGELGYGFSGQQGELLKSCVSFTNNKGYSFGLMGWAGVQAPALTCTTTSCTAWTTNLVVPNATAYFGGGNSSILPIPSTPPTEVFGVPVSADNVLTLGDIDVASGLMGAQVIHRFFGTLGYVWEDCCWDWKPSLEIMASVGVSPITSYSPEMWEVGARLGIDY